MYHELTSSCKAISGYPILQGSVILQILDVMTIYKKTKIEKMLCQLIYGAKCDVSCPTDVMLSLISVPPFLGQHSLDYFMFLPQCRTQTDFLLREADNYETDSYIY